jgi:mannose-1-phosphate guanylyltransferase
MTAYVCILAGGSGTRLWPLSRSTRPKQLISLLSERSLVQATVDRVLPLVPAERVLIVTEASHAGELRDQLPEIPEENVVVEPMRRGTAAAVGLGATIIAHRDPDATMISLHSDAAVRDEDGFRGAVRGAVATAESGDWLVTLGIRPSSPHTGMGYIEVGDPLGVFDGVAAYVARRFVEKPDPEAAQRFVALGYLWNPGMFVWRVQVILDRFAELLPDAARELSRIGAALGGGDWAEVLADRYAQIPAETIDYGIMERAERVATLPSDFGWSDLGNWAEVLAIAAKDEAGNWARGRHLGLNTRGTLVYGSDKPVVTMGIDDLVVVDLPDVLLVCRRDQAEQMKLVVERLQSSAEWSALL